MRKAKFFMKAVLITMMLIGSLLAFEMSEAEEEDSIEQYISQLSVFGVTVNVFDSDGQPSLIVDEVTTFQVGVAVPPENPQSYTLLYLIDGRFEGKHDGVSLPFEFKQDYRGLFNGTYNVEFILVNNQGQAGKAQVTITVQH